MSRLRASKPTTIEPRDWPMRVNRGQVEDSSKYREVSGTRMRESSFRLLSNKYCLERIDPARWRRLVSRSSLINLLAFVEACLALESFSQRKYGTAVSKIQGQAQRRTRRLSILQIALARGAQSSSSYRDTRILFSTDPPLSCLAFARPSRRDRDSRFLFASHFFISRLRKSSAIHNFDYWLEIE